MKTVHGWQALICPLCPKSKEHKTPSGRRKHIKKSHNSDARDSPNVLFCHRPCALPGHQCCEGERESANTKKALEMSEQWAELVETERSRRLYTTVLHDWTCHLGNQMSRKRKNETESVPKTKKMKETPTTSQTQKPGYGWDLTILDAVIRGKTSYAATLSTVPARLPAACGDKHSDARYLQLRDAPQDPFSPRNYTGGIPRHQVGGPSLPSRGCTVAWASACHVLSSSRHR